MNANRIEEIIMDCLFEKDEIDENGKPLTPFIEAEGVMDTFAFNPDKIAKHKEEIKSILSELDDSFMIGKGGGMSFLNMCMDKHGIQWGEHMHVDQLIALGIAAGFVKYCMPRDMWRMFPGGMPYVQVDLGE